jgi:hypothetical protein
METKKTIITSKIDFLRTHTFCDVKAIQFSTAITLEDLNKTNSLHCDYI